MEDVREKGLGASERQLRQDFEYQVKKFKFYPKVNEDLGLRDGCNQMSFPTKSIQSIWKRKSLQGKRLVRILLH